MFIPLSIKKIFLKDFKDKNYNLVIENSREILKNPNFSEKEFLYNLVGLSYFHQSLFDEAIKAFKKCLDINKKNFQCLVNLGSAYLKLLNFNQAEIYLKEALKLKPNDINTHLIFSKLLFVSKRAESGIQYLKMINKEYQDLNIKFEIGRIYIHLKEYNNALPWFLEINKTNPKNVSILNNLGVCYENLNKIDECIECFLKAFNLQKDNLSVINNLANAYRSVGNFEKALWFYELSISKNEKLYENHRQISSIKKYKLTEDDHLCKMINLDKTNHPDDEKIELLFALSKAFEDLKNYDLSGQYILRANKAANKKVTFDIDHTMGQFNSLKEIFKKKYINSELLKFSKTPIFIVGMPRSGTTLVEQIISSHSDVYSGGELYFLQKQIKNFFPAKENNIFSKEVISSLDTYKQRIGHNYILDLDFLTDKSYVTDKLPFNFLFIGFIKECLPNSKIIHIKRNPIDNCFSIYKNFFPFQEIGFVYDQKNLAIYYNLYNDLMDFWKLVYKDLYEINYEDLIGNQLDVSKKMIKYCELEWQDSCYEFYKNKTMVKTLSTTQVRSKIYNSSIQSWKPYEKILIELISNLKL